MSRITVQGRERLNKRLRAMPAVVKAELRKAMAASAEEIVMLAKRLVPVDSGDLQMSISWTWGEAPKGTAVLMVSAPDPDGMRITIYAGGGDAFYQRFIEFGTENMPAQPFFFPAYRALRRRARSRISRAMTRGVKKAAGK